jgi:hypothetical protein
VRPLRLGVVAVLAVAAMAGPTAGGAVVTPTQRAVQVATLSLKGQHGQRWEALHPKYRAVVSKARFVACETKAAAGLGKLTIKGVAAEGTSVFHVTLPLLGAVDVNDVTLAVTFRRGAAKQDQIAEVESLWVANRGHWVHALTPDEYKAYKADKCP